MKSKPIEILNVIDRIKGDAAKVYHLMLLEESSNCSSGDLFAVKTDLDRVISNLYQILGRSIREQEQSDKG